MKNQKTLLIIAISFVLASCSETTSFDISDCDCFSESHEKGDYNETYFNGELFTGIDCDFDDGVLGNTWEYEEGKQVAYTTFWEYNQQGGVALIQSIMTETDSKRVSKDFYLTGELASVHIQELEDGEWITVEAAEFFPNGELRKGYNPEEEETTTYNSAGKEE